jgi:hypothetical protein
MRLRLFGILAVLIVLTTACDVFGQLIDTPDDGTLVDTVTVPVTGTVPDYTGGGTLTVAGIPTTVNPDGTWSQNVPVNPANLVTEVEAVYTKGNNTTRERINVVYTPNKLDDGEFSPNGVGMNFTNGGLAALGPVIQDLAGGAFDIEPMLVAQNPIINTDFEIILGIMAHVTGNVYEAGFDSVGMTTSATAAGMATNVSINNFYIGVDLNISGFGTCKLELNIPTMNIGGTYNLEPAPGDPSHVDVNMVGNPNVVTTGLNYDFISGVCDPDAFLIGGLVSSLAGGQIGGSIDSAFNTSLGDPDGAGPQDSVIADAIETALAEISIAGEVGAAVKANLDAPFTAITESSSGLSLKADADFFATEGTGPADCLPPDFAPNVPSTVDIPGTYPTLGATTPGGAPYGIGLVISASAFNQLLGAMTECGILNQEITSIDLGTGPIPITSNLLSLFVPQFATSPGPNQPMKIRVRPTATAPFLTDQAGPNGEMGELQLANLELDFLWASPLGDVPMLTLALDAPMGFELDYDPVGGVLKPTITAPAPAAIGTRVVYNGIGTDENNVEALFPNLFPTFASGIGDTFAAFPLPSFLGLQFGVVDMVRQGQYFVLYGNLNQTPQTQISNVTLTDLSDANYEEDDTLSDSAQWRHKIRKNTSSTSINVHYRGTVDADSGIGSDEDRSGLGAYRLNFNVTPENGETWRIDLAQSLMGAHTHLDEGYQAQSEFQVPSGFSNRVVGRVRIGGGAWQNFDFNPANAASSTSGNTSTQVSGSNSTFIQGTTAQAITVEFYLRARAFSDGRLGWPWEIDDGDESSIRFGLNDTLTNGFTAGEYPGTGFACCRSTSTDGWFANIALTTVP